mgnify:CR=1 FL=1
MVDFMDLSVNPFTDVRLPSDHIGYLLFEILKADQELREKYPDHDSEHFLRMEIFRSMSIMAERHEKAVRQGKPVMHSKYEEKYNAEISK